MIPMPSINGIVKRNPHRRPYMHLVMALLTDHITVAQFKTDSIASFVSGCKFTKDHRHMPCLVSPMPSGLLRTDSGKLHFVACLFRWRTFACMNQIIAVVAIFGIITAVFAPLIAETGSQIFSSTNSISDSMDISRQKAGQNLVATHIEQRNGTTNIYVSNIGIEEIRIHVVLVDGIKSGFLIKDQNSTGIDVLDSGHVGTISIMGTGDRVHVITTVNRLFEFVT